MTAYLPGYSAAEAAYLREPDPEPDDYCDLCDGAPCVCDELTDAYMDELDWRDA